MVDGPERVPSSSLIPGASKSFSNMHSEQDVSTVESMAPSWHRGVMDKLVASGKVRTEEQFTPVREEIVMAAPRQKKRYITGARVQHIKNGKKLTIIHAKAGHTKNSNVDVHKCADREGNIWLVPETKLELL